MACMLLALIIPSLITLNTIQEPRPMVPVTTPNASPYGYTWSLSLFIIPCLILLTWLHLSKEHRIQMGAFWLTVVLMATLGLMLDIFLGLTFFNFTNTGATLGIHFWGYSFANGWQKLIPIEEVGFYASGCLAILLVYIWSNECWLEKYKVDKWPPRFPRLKDAVSFHPASAISGVVLIVLGCLFKKYFPGVDHEGFPGYYIFIVAVAITPSIVFYEVAAPFVNWRAYTLAFFSTMLVSLFWEGALAVPYQWWGYNPKQMLGFFLNGLSGLPVEEPILWIAASWAIVIIFETINSFFHMKLLRLEQVLENKPVSK